MSAAPDAPSPVGPAPGAASGHELEVDVTAFLPEGTILAGDDVDAPEGAEATDDPVPPDDADTAPVTAGPTAPAWSATLAVRPEPDADDVPVAADEHPEPEAGRARAVAMAADEAAWAATAPVDPPPPGAAHEPETVEAEPEVEPERQAEPEVDAEPTRPEEAADVEERAADVEEPEGAAATPAPPPDPVTDGSAPVGQVDVAGADQIDPEPAEADPAPADPEPEAAPRPAPVDLGALAQLEADLSAVDAAIAAVDEGTYGSCAICGSSIDDDLLAGDPVRRGCAAHPEGAALG